MELMVFVATSQLVVLKIYLDLRLERLVRGRIIVWTRMNNAYLIGHL